MPVMRMATIPQASQEIDDSPGSVGIGKRVRSGGKEYPAISSPSGDKPKSKIRRMQRQRKGEHGSLRITTPVFISPVLL